MGSFGKKGAFAKQTALFLKNRDYKKAYSLAREFAAAYPHEMVSHYLLAKAAFWLENNDEAVSEGRKAFNLAREPDLVPCAIIMASAYFRLGKFKEGHYLLARIKAEGEVELESLRMAFAIAMGNGDEAIRQIDRIDKLNRRAADKLIKRILGA